MNIFPKVLGEKVLLFCTRATRKEHPLCLRLGTYFGVDSKVPLRAFQEIIVNTAT